MPVVLQAYIIGIQQVELMLYSVEKSQITVVGMLAYISPTMYKV